MPPCPLFAQTLDPSREQDSANRTGATANLTIAAVESQLAEMEANAGIESAVKDLLRPKYKQAMEALKQAAANTETAAEYKNAISTAPKKTADLRARLQKVQSEENGVELNPRRNTKELQAELDSRRAAIDVLGDELSKLASALTAIKRRPVEISDRLPDAQRELSDLRANLESPDLAAEVTSPGRVADRTLLQAKQAVLLSELDLLKQEQLSLSVREDLLQAQHDLKAYRFEIDAAALKQLQALVNERLAQEAEQLGFLAGMTPLDISSDDKPLQALAAEVQGLAKEFEQVVASLKEVPAAQEDVAARLDRLMADYECIRDQLNLGGGGEDMAQFLFDLVNRVDDPRVYAAERSRQIPTLDETRNASLRVQIKNRDAGRSGRAIC